MQDLNDMRFFAEVVDQNGFAAAARKLGMPRSRLSRRVGLLEDRLGIRLVHRSTRRFTVTEIGREYYRHCVAMMVEAEAAQETIDRMRTEPQGVVRVSCPSSLIYFQIGEMIARFMEQYPKVAVQLESTNRRVDVIREGNPAVLEHEWQLDGPDGATATISHRPRFATEDMMALRLAALRGIGVCQFPAFVVADDLASGQLVDVLPEWSPKAGIIHAVFPSRRGLLPSVRALLDFLATEYAVIARAALPS